MYFVLQGSGYEYSSIAYISISNGSSHRDFRWWCFYLCCFIASFRWYVGYSSGKFKESVLSFSQSCVSIVTISFVSLVSCTNILTNADIDRVVKWCHRFIYISGSQWQTSTLINVWWWRKVAYIPDVVLPTKNVERIKIRTLDN